MMGKSIPAVGIIAVSLAVSGSMARAAQDKYTVKVPNGLAFSGFRGYESWQTVSIDANGTAVASASSWVLGDVVNRGRSANATSLLER